MYKIRLTISLLLLVTSLSFAQDIDFQKNTSGAKMMFVDDKLYSDQLIVKFKEHIIEFHEGTEFVSGLDIKSNFLNIINTFQSICDREGLLLENILFYKAISGCKAGQTKVYSPQKKCLVTVPDLSLVYIIKFPKPLDIQSILEDLLSLSEVKYAHQPVQTIEFASSPPNDPEYLADKQWYLNKVQAQNAWNISLGSNEVKLAVIDQSGVKSSHVDLSSKYVGGDGDTSYDLQSSHGTKVAGVAAAATNNNIGIASLGWNTSLLTYRFTSEDENRENLANDIKEAADDGADVMVMCFGTSKSHRYTQM
ncbi:MAG: S8 family serine peptidase [bacterium]|nr:S8 family serine peptidase [bacterium]